MYIIGIALIIVALVLWAVAMSLGKRQQGLYEHQRFVKYAGAVDEDEEMLLKDIKALKVFAKKLRMIGAGSAFIGFVMFLI